MIEEFKKLFDALVAEDRFNVSCDISVSETAGAPTSKCASVHFSYPKCITAGDFEEIDEEVDTGEEDYEDCTGGDDDTPSIDELKKMVREAIKSFGGDAGKDGADVKVEEIPGGVCMSFRKIVDDDEQEEPPKKCCNKKCTCKKSGKASPSLAEVFSFFNDGGSPLDNLDSDIFKGLRSKFGI